MGQALYRVYRSKSLSEVVGQEHVTETLEKALRNKIINHAYLFTGPKGVGKTSVARILAYELNESPYNDQTTSLDIIEIDAASNRRIDEIRDLKDRVQIAPAHSKYKIYIIDEVHMLTREAFNALLKTLEEPPSHVIFILATTEPHRLPETILSRTQRFSFKPASQEKVIEHLKFIAKKEKISVSDDALKIIADHGDGSFRDSIGILDQVRNLSGPVKPKDVLNLLGYAPDDLIDRLTEVLASGQLSEIVVLLQQIYDQGVEAAQISKQLNAKLKQLLLTDKSLISISETINLMKKMVNIPASLDPQIELELVLLDTMINRSEKPHEAKVDDETKPQSREEPATVVSSKEESLKSALPEKALKTSLTDQDKIWERVLSEIKQKHSTLYGIVRMAVPEWGDGNLTLSFKFAFHQRRMNDAKYQALLSKTIQDITGKDIEIICIVNNALPENIDKVSETGALKPDENNKLIDSISNIFGGAELLESE
ncbi:MAG TPA: DNA polymerase III subunit gamma/tau [Candidatus Saccharimonadales bacterium]|nr:DNA polymerase III subunit gamma/tau [Candidatus Saccharimonadales bacterium]